jgi:hypothetical protein
MNDPPLALASSSSLPAAVRYHELGLGRLTRRVSQRRQGSLASHLRSIYLDAQVRGSVDGASCGNKLCVMSLIELTTLNQIRFIMQFVRSVVTAYRQAGNGPSPSCELQEGEEEEEGPQRLPFAVFANLRNGEWYLPPVLWDGRVYFKVSRVNLPFFCVVKALSFMSSVLPAFFAAQSTDGHSGHWDFSRTRLNLQLAVQAARRGGAIVVDSTRRGKVSQSGRCDKTE